MAPRGRLSVNNNLFTKSFCGVTRFSRTALQPASVCIALGLHSQPENHEAICSDPVELLAQPSEDRYDSGYQAPRNGSEAFPAKIELPAARFGEELSNGAG